MTILHELPLPSAAAISGIPYRTQLRSCSDVQTLICDSEQCLSNEYRTGFEAQLCHTLCRNAVAESVSWLPNGWPFFFQKAQQFLITTVSTMPSYLPKSTIQAAVRGVRQSILIDGIAGPAEDSFERFVVAAFEAITQRDMTNVRDVYVGRAGAGTWCGTDGRCGNHLSCTV
jgi:hypothetical protein